MKQRIFRRMLALATLVALLTGTAMFALRWRAGLDELAEQTQCTIVGQAAVLAEGDAAQRKDIIFLEPLPLFLH